MQQLHKTLATRHLSQFEKPRDFVSHPAKAAQSGELRLAAWTTTSLSHRTRMTGQELSTVEET
jgi:hypothetical protein